MLELDKKDEDEDEGEDEDEEWELMDENGKAFTLNIVENNSWAASGRTGE